MYQQNPQYQQNSQYQQVPPQDQSYVQTPAYQQGVEMVPYGMQQQMMMPPSIVDIIGSLPGVFIKQQMEWFQLLTGFETKNSYLIYPGTINGEKVGETPLIRVKEQSSCISRCLFPDFRPFKLNFYSYLGPVSKADPHVYKDQKSLVSQANHPYQCSVLCCNRPTIELNFCENGVQKYLGKIVNPWYCCCDIGVNVYDDQNNLKYVVEASCTQCYFFFPRFPCDACQNVKFTIKDATGQVISEMFKKSPNLCSICTNQDNFRIVFPPSCSKFDKMLLICATIFVDYRYFENKNQKQGLEVGGINV